MTLFSNIVFRKKTWIITFVISFVTLATFGQVPDSIATPTIAPVLPAIDTIIPNPLDSLRRNIATRRPVKDSIQFNISKEALDEEVIYKAKDSMRLDAANQVVYLYGEAEVKYTTITLTAGFIRVDMKNNLITAGYVKNALGQKIQQPLFTEGNITPITADSMYYNFITKKGRILNTTTTQAGGYINSSVAKIIMKQDSVEHSSDELYGQNAIYTTCDHPEPHYGLRSSKQKVIPDKLVVIGPSNIEIMGIPTPLWLPFGFFPLTEGQSGGLIFPKDYEYSPSWGYGLRNIGWYFGLGERADLQVLGDIYTRGSWGLRGVSRYKNRYKNSGNVELGFSRRISGDPIADNTSPQSSVKFRWSHSQDAKAHPYNTFRASVNIETNNFDRLNNNDAQSVLNSELTSNISYSRRFPGKPFSLSASFGHRQNVNTHDIRFNLPTVDFTMKKIFPFQSKRPGGKEQWYEKIGIAYTGKVQNTITGKDTLLFSQPSTLDFSYGAKHSVPINANFKLFKYINVSPFVNYSERWFLNTLNRQFDNTISVAIDTTFDENGEPLSIQTDTTFGQVNDIMDNGFRSLRELSGGVSLNTQLFGLLNIRRGPVKAIRHIAKPSVSFTYTPDYTNDFWGYWKDVQYDTRYPDEVETYNVFQGGLFGQASQGGSQSVSYSLTNIFEAKVVNRRDTINPIQKIKLLNNLSFSGNYNLAADSLNMSVFSASGNTTILKRINLSFGFTADPLAADRYTNRRINTYEWSENRRVARITSARLSANTRLDSKFFDELFGKNKPAPKPSTDNSPGAPTGSPTTLNQGRSQSSQKSNYGLLQNLSINYSLAMSRKYFEGVDSAFISQHTLRVSGGTVNFTENWKLRIGGVGYDFVRQTFTYPDFSLSRDLHCWEMGFSWQPQRGTYAFYVRVKQGSQLDFLNVPYRRNNYDPLGGF